MINNTYDAQRKEMDKLIQYYEKKLTPISDKINEMDGKKFSSTEEVDIYTQDNSFQGLLKTDEIEQKNQQELLQQSLIKWKICIRWK